LGRKNLKEEIKKPTPTETEFSHPKGEGEIDRSVSVGLKEWVGSENIFTEAEVRTPTQHLY